MNQRWRDKRLPETMCIAYYRKVLLQTWARCTKYLTIYHTIIVTLS